MKSDVIVVQSNGKGREEALCQTEAVAVFKGLNKQNTIHLRLLAEEMIGMLNAMVGEVQAEYWLQDADQIYELHLKAKTRLDPDMRENLLSVSSSGRNAAAKGIMGKIRDIFTQALEARSLAGGVYDAGYYYEDSGMIHMGMINPAGSWSLNQYRSNLPKSREEEWDELEKSIIANLADEVEIFIQGGYVELVIYKKF